MRRLARWAFRLGPVVLSPVLALALSARFGAGFVGSGSMLPTLLPGDLVVFDRQARPSVRDVVVYDKAGWPGGVVHRVVATAGDGSLRTRGDANPVEDRDPVKVSAVQGKVVGVLPLGRALVLVRGVR